MFIRPARIHLIGRTALAFLAVISCTAPLGAQENQDPNAFDADALLDAFRRTPDPAPQKPAAEVEAAVEVETFVPVSIEAGRMPPLSEHLQPYRNSSFLEERHKIAPRLPVLGSDGLTYFHLVATLDLAYLYATHGLWAEAGSISRSGASLYARLLGVSPESDRELALLRAELDRIDAIVFLMDPRFAKNRESARPLLDAYAQSWPDIALYQAILESETGNAGGASPLLASAGEILDDMPAAWRAQVLPILIEGAVVSGSEALAETLMADLTRLAARTPDGILPYLKGVRSERQGKIQEAMDLYGKASGHDDMFAQRSRLARIRLGLTEGILDIEQARAELAIARNSWHGDDLALSALRLAIDIERDTGHPLEALLALEEIRLRYPEAVGVVSEQEKWALVQDFYTPADGSTRPFADLLAGHRRIAEIYGSEFGFFQYAESMGDQLRTFGALRLAGEEYARVLEDIAGMEESFEQSPEAKRVLGKIEDRLRIKQAEALLEIGDAAAVIDLLDLPLRDTADAETVDRLTVLRARAAFEEGDLSLVYDGKTSRPIADHLRLVAQSQALQKDWSKARASWIALFDIAGVTPEGDDLDRFTLASEMAGKIAEDRSRISALSSAASHPQPAAYAAILAEPVVELRPLTRDILENHTERAGRTLDVAKGERQ